MKSKIFLALCAAGVLATTSCSDYLETSSPSTADANFVFSNMTTAQAAMDGAYAKWHEAIQSHVFGDGMFYALDIAGSDIMRHPEAYANQKPRHEPESFYTNGKACAAYNAVTYFKEDASNPYSVLFAVLSSANAVASAIEETDDYKKFNELKEPTDLSDLYGQAICLRATVYRELIKYFGDVPYQTNFGVAAGNIVPRDAIYDWIISKVDEVAPLMKVVTKSGKNHFSRTYAYALEGRLALEAAGYQTRRGDMSYYDGNLQELQFDKLGDQNNDGCFYGRRTDYIELYKTAKKAYDNCMANLGACSWCADYETFFNELHASDTDYATESIYEEPYTQGANANDARSYSFGRPSSGGSANGYPCKAYGQGRVNPAFYYGVFDPKDVRRDLACTVTGSTGKGYETLIPFTPNSKAAGGGISCNKFDENRQSTVWTAKQRTSGINAPYLRLSEVYLGYAEACQVLGEQGLADQYYNMIRQRAGLDAKSKVTFEQIIDERGFEFAAEGDRRWTLIRTGLMPQKIKTIKELTRQMLDGLKNNGYYQFSNGNVISNVIYTKMVDPKSSEFGLKSRLVGASTDKTNPVTYPGWRGQKDWENVSGFTAYSSNSKSNLAITGLFTSITPSQLTMKALADIKDEAGNVIAKKGAVMTTITGTSQKDVVNNIKAYLKGQGVSDANVKKFTSLVDCVTDDGYSLATWGSDLVDNDDEYYKYLFLDYDYRSAPIYLVPFSPNTLATGGFTNGYGFAN